MLFSSAADPLQKKTKSNLVLNIDLFKRDRIIFTKQLSVLSLNSTPKVPSLSKIQSRSKKLACINMSLYNSVLRSGQA